LTKVAKSDKEIEGETFFCFLVALKKALAGSSSSVLGVESMGMGDSKSSGVASIRGELPAPFLWGSNSPVNLALFFFFLNKEGLELGGVVFTILCRRGGKRVVFGGLAFLEVFEDFLEGSFVGLVVVV
jgi:hypothetical protein